MISLFSGVRSDGTLLFIDDASSGLQMDCLCPVCRSPLVAKKGTVNDWHFAHQALQERPECKVGAMNLLRQLCKEAVLASPPVHIPALHLSRQMPFGSEQIEVSHTRGAVDPFLPPRKPGPSVLDSGGVFMLN